MRIQFFVEGDTERIVLPGFIARWLNPRLTVPVEIPAPVNLQGCGGFIQEIGKSAKGHLRSADSNDLIAVVGLLDLKGPEAHHFYPPGVTAIQDRYEWGKRKIEQYVDHPKFHMFFAVHEIEAWLFSQPEIFPEFIREALFEGLPEPEEIDFDTPPSKRLKKTYDTLIQQKSISHAYRKTGHGRKFFNSLDPERAYAKCPYLRKMLDALLSVSKKAGL